MSAEESQKAVMLERVNFYNFQFKQTARWLLLLFIFLILRTRKR